MLRRFALGIALLTLLATGSARAAAIPVVDLVFVPAGPGSDSLNLFLSIAPDAPLQTLLQLQFHIVSNPTTDFTISPSAIALGVDQFSPLGFSYKAAFGNDLFVALVGSALPSGGGFAGPGTQNMLIGTLTNAQGVTIDSFISRVEDGGTLIREDLEAIGPYRVTIGDTSRIYPEPDTGLLLGLAGLSLSGCWLRARTAGSSRPLRALSFAR